MPVITNCLICNKEIKSKPSYIKKFCSLTCTGIYNSQRQDNGLTKQCAICGKAFKVKPSEVERRKTCSRKCNGEYGKQTGRYEGLKEYYGDKKGQDHPNWKGGRRIHQGYVYLWIDGKPIAEHRYVMEQHLGRPLTDDEEVHHRYENRQNNDISNLEVMTKFEHRSHHSSKRARKLVEEGIHHFLK